MSTTKKKWLGGPIVQGKRGLSYVIEKWIDGKHWHVSTKCRTERAALKELEKFEMAPSNYRRARSAKSNGVEMTPELVAEYLKHMKARQLDPPYINANKTYLGEALEVLAGHDLSRMSFAELRTMIDGTSSLDKPAALAARRKAIKAFGTWLRKWKALLTRANDPTMDLTIEYATPEKNRRRKAMSIELVERAIAKMEPDVADVAIVLAGTGLHIRELGRLHAGLGDLYEPAEWQREQGVVLNVGVQHKDKKKTHVVAITDQGAADAVRRVLARKEFPTRGRITKHDENVSAAIGEKFSMGWLRHSVATWLAKRRVSEADIASQLGHTSTRMARSTYIDLGMSAQPQPIPRLKLVKG